MKKEKSEKSLMMNSDKESSSMLRNIFVILVLMTVVFFTNMLLINVSHVENLPISDNGNLEIEKQDQFSPIVDLKLSRFLSNITLLSNYSINDEYVNISTDGYIPLVGELICLKEISAFYQGDILEVVSLGGNNYQVRLDKPLDYAFTVVAGCSLRDSNWASDGSIETLIYSVSPEGLSNQSWDITRVLLVCKGDGVSGASDVPDMSSFFTTDPIERGIVFRRVDGTNKNIFSARDNFHLVSETYDLTIYPKNKFGLYAVTSRRSFNGEDKNGVTVRIDGDTGDTFELLNRDDLTDMDECHAVVQGHVVE